MLFFITVALVMVSLGRNNTMAKISCVCRVKKTYQQRELLPIVVRFGEPFFRDWEKL